MIPKIDGMRESKRPEAMVGLIRPVQHLMEKHGASPLSNCLDGAFGNAILMMGSYSGKIDGLIAIGDFVAKRFGPKRVIIGSVRLDCASQRLTMPLIFSFCTDRLS